MANEKVLIIDDEPIPIAVYHEVLEYGGFKVISANGGVEGLRLFQEHHPDVVLLDLRMPDLDGFEVLEKIKEMQIKTRVIIISGLFNYRDVVRIAQAGACDFLDKTSDVKTILNTINRALIMENPENILQYYRDERTIDLVKKVENLQNEVWNLQGKNDQLKVDNEKLNNEIKRVQQADGQIPIPDNNQMTKTRKKEINHPNRKIFLVHGHDQDIKETVARFLEKIELIPIILKEQPNLNRGIFEKLEKYNDVQFALILLSPDDVGKGKNEQTELKTRPRQNVILELGYFIGLLGRERVCLLRKNVEDFPSDYAGILNIEYDEKGAWKVELGRDLQASGYKIPSEKFFS
jgi:predicted nucleotide-binding protein